MKKKTPEPKNQFLVALAVLILTTIGLVIVVALIERDGDRQAHLKGLAAKFERQQFQIIMLEKENLARIKAENLAAQERDWLKVQIAQANKDLSEIPTGKVRLVQGSGATTDTAKAGNIASGVDSTSTSLTHLREQAKGRSPARGHDSNLMPGYPWKPDPNMSVEKYNDYDRSLYP